MKRIVECVPNISEGSDRQIIEACASAAAEVEGVTLLDVDPGADTNRTVITIAGEPEAVLEGAFRLIAESHRRIDMTKHKGEHPRAGATDVCPFVPVANVSMEECVELAQKLGERVGKELDVPVYLYEFAASKPEWQNLAEVRKGEYEALPKKMKDPAWKPDFGPHEFRPSFGAVHISARKFLIAYNINLNSRHARIAKDIALRIREKGHVLRNSKREIIRGRDGKPAVHVPGIFSNCKAGGWYLDDIHQAQVTMNLTDMDVTAPHHVFDKVEELARGMGARVTGSEIVGLIPLQPMLEAGRYFLHKQSRSTAVHERELVRVAIESMGLEDVAEFDPEKKIVEYAIAEKGADALASMSLTEFNHVLASESPAPGGGSVAALAGALAASLATMVTNLTHGKYEYEPAWPKMEEVGVQGQSLLTRLLKAIDEDTEAFNRVMAVSGSGDPERIEQANQHATAVPFSVCEDAFATFDLLDAVAAQGNPNSVSDAGVGAYCAHAAVHGAALNVRINLPGVSDAAFRDRMAQGVERMTRQANERLAAVVEVVDKVLAKQQG